MKKVLNFYINSSLHLAFSVTALAVISVLQFQIELNSTVLLFIFLSTITGYNFVKYAGLAKLHHKSLTGNLRGIQVFSFFSFAGLLYVASLQSEKVLWITVLLGIVTFFYAVPFLPNQTNLRNLKSLKIFIIALVWAGATVLIPLINQHPIFEQSVLLSFFQRFLFVVALTIPFEVRDVIYDEDHLGTLPQLLGVENSKKIGYILLISFVVLKFFIETVTWIQFLPKLITALAVGIFIYKSTKKQNRYFSSFWVEAIPIFWLALEVIVYWLL
ncbi:hypothetical protein ACFSO9_14885 [Mesonia maritima]